jgi:hypothetical protein
MNQNGPIYTSSDSGATWLPSDAPITNWMSVASSADGGKLVGVVYQGGIYTSQSPVAPHLNAAVPSRGNLVLSWTIPSMSFVLQQNSDLSSTNWTNVAVPPTVDYTSLQYRVTVSGSSKAVFYRLAQTTRPPSGATP